MNRLITIGFLSMLAATLILAPSYSFAADGQRVDVIDHLPSVNQADSMNVANHPVQRVDVIEHIGSKGPQYPLTSAAMRVDVIDSLKSQGPTHSSTSVAGSVDVIDGLLSVGRQLSSVKPAGEQVRRVDFIDSLPAKSQWDSAKATRDYAKRMDFIDRIESRGPVYPSTTGAMRVDVISSIGV